MKIGIVEDFPSTAQMLQQALALNPAHYVIWTAQTGAEALERCRTDKPDLVLLDLLMADMNSAEIVRRIMASSPCAILIVTDSVPANAARVFDLMGCGALDAVDVPATSFGNLEKVAQPLLMKIETIARLIGDTNGNRRSGAERARSALGIDRDRLVAIGSSAGGRSALATLLGGLPKDFPAAIVIVQHVDERFVAGMSDWLSQQSALPVRVAKEGDRLTPGRVLIAGTGDHLTLKASSLVGYTPEPSHYVYRPSVDVFFESVSKLWRGDVVGVLLTGMGKDGARGLKALRNKGHYTIAQDAGTSAVYGMPEAAAALNAAVDILPMPRIAPRLVEVFAGTENGRISLPGR